MQMSSIFRGLFFGFCAVTLCFGTGCVTQFDLDKTPVTLANPQAKIPARINLVIPPVLRSYVYDQDLHTGDHWKYPIGEPVAIDAQKTAEAAFTQVITSDGSAPPSSPVDGVLRPEIGLVKRSIAVFAFDPVDFTIDLKWTLTTPKGDVVWIDTIRGSAKHELGNGFGFREAAKQHVQATLTDLFNKSLVAFTTTREIAAVAHPSSP